MLPGMPLIRSVLFAFLLSSILVAAPAAAQENGAAEEPEAPVLSELNSNWWNYFDGAPDEIKPRVETFLALANEQIAGLGAQNHEIAPGIVEAVADNFEVYLSLLGDVEYQTKVLPEPAATYTLDDLLGVAETARGATDAADAAQAEVEREQRILNGASRRRDALFKDYLGAAEGDQRWLTGLRLIRARSEQAHGRPRSPVELGVLVAFRGGIRPDVRFARATAR